MAANIEAIKKRYGFKELSVTQWRNPAQSTLQFRGSQQTKITPEAAAAPFLPTYRRILKLPDPEEEHKEEASEEGKSNSPVQSAEFMLC